MVDPTSDKGRYLLNLAAVDNYVNSDWVINAIAVLVDIVLSILCSSCQHRVINAMREHSLVTSCPCDLMPSCTHALVTS